LATETTTPLAVASDEATVVAPGAHRALARQILVSRLFAPLWVPLATVIMRLGFRWRIRDAARTRAFYARLMREDPRPLMIVANHLTMADSPLIAWGLGSTLGHIAHYRGLPWNVPEQSRVRSSWLWRVLAYLVKCLPVPRNGDRAEVARVLDDLRHLMRRGEAVLMFPEGGRSRTGRIDTEAPAHGVGRLIKEVGDCRVLCVYMRGDKQQTWSNIPAANDTFSVSTRLIEPKTRLRGLRGSRDIATQVLAQLAEMEREYLANR
jgi:hypothetical protein